MENVHIQKPTKFSPCMAPHSERSKAARTVLVSISQMAMLQLSRRSKAAKLMSSRLQSEPRCICLTPKPWLPAFTHCYFPIHSLHKYLLSTYYETGTVLGAWDTTINKSGERPCPPRGHIQPSKHCGAVESTLHSWEDFPARPHF